jgi:hypothetical protein
MTYDEAFCQQMLVGHNDDGAGNVEDFREFATGRQTLPSLHSPFQDYIAKPKIDLAGKRFVLPQKWYYK